jgi:hypothetical protein
VCLLFLSWSLTRQKGDGISVLSVDVRTLFGEFSMISGACQISSSDILWVFGILIGFGLLFSLLCFMGVCHTHEIFTMAFWGDYGRLFGLQWEFVWWVAGL